MNRPDLECLQSLAAPLLNSLMITYTTSPGGITVEQLSGLYMVDLLCDENLLPFYEKLGMRRAAGAFVRNYDWQT
jgi:hypothetical protein